LSEFHHMCLIKQNHGFHLSRKALINIDVVSRQEDNEQLFSTYFHTNMQRTNHDIFAEDKKP